MLNNGAQKEKYKTVVLVGSTSDIGLSIIAELPTFEDSSILLIGRSIPIGSLSLRNFKEIDFFRSDLEIEDDLICLISKISSLQDVDLAIVAAGYLPPEDTETNVEEVKRSLKVNGFGVPLILSALTERMRSQKKGKILLISTVASMRPRLRNFTYGAGKKSADFFAEGLFYKYRDSNLSISILRPGFVFTKMSRNFRPAPFAISSLKVAQITVKSLRTPKKVIYAPRILRFVMLLLCIFPRRMFDYLGK